MVSLSHWGGFFSSSEADCRFQRGPQISLDLTWCGPGQQLHAFVHLSWQSKHVLNAIFFFCYTFLSSKWYLQSVKETSLLSPFRLSAGSGLTYQSSMSTLHFSEIQGQEHFTLHHHLDTHAHKLSRMQHWISDPIGVLLFSGQFSAFSFEATRWNPKLNWKSRGGAFLSCVLFLQLFILFPSLDVGPVKASDGGLIPDKEVFCAQ